MTDLSPRPPSFFKKWLIRFVFAVGIITILIVLGFFWGIKAFFKDSHSPKEKVAHVKLYGTIVSIKESSEWIHTTDISADEILEILEEISEDKNIKGILLEINSPGGSAVASQDIAQAIGAFKIPTLAWIREAGASGAYWIASACDFIIASPMSITGSIGVIANNFGFEDALQALHIRYRRQIAGDMKDIGDPFRAQTEQETQYMQHVLNQIHQTFIQEVEINRKFVAESWAKDLANGIFFTGKDALKHKLIDKLGSKKEALAWMSHRLDSPVELVKYQKEPSILDFLFGEVRLLAQEFVKVIQGTLPKKSISIQT
jgi:protease-4